MIVMELIITSVDANKIFRMRLLRCTSAYGFTHRWLHIFNHSLSLLLCNETTNACLSGINDNCTYLLQVNLYFGI